MQSKQRSIKIGLSIVGSVLGCLLMSHLIISVAGKSKSDKNPIKHHVAIICKSTQSAFFKAVFAGASAASSEYNLTVSYGGPSNEEDEETQNKLISQAVEDGAKVIVLSAVDYNANAKAVEEAANKGVKTIVIDSDVNTKVVGCRIGTNNYKAGEMAGVAALSCKDEVLNIGIVNFDKNSANGQQREEGFREKVSKDPRVQKVQTIHVNSNIDEAKEATKELLIKHPEINVITTFNEWTSLGVGYAISELGLKDKVTVVAFDNNVVSVGMLESGEVDALIVQNPYAMGYLGVEYAYKYIYELPVGKEQIDTSTMLITRENMYEEECQRILFPFN